LQLLRLGTGLVVLYSLLDRSHALADLQERVGLPTKLDIFSRWSRTGPLLSGPIRCGAVQPVQKFCVQVVEPLCRLCFVARRWLRAARQF
jgi:hypothetical protein